MTHASQCNAFQALPSKEFNASKYDMVSYYNSILRRKGIWQHWRLLIYLISLDLELTIVYMSPQELAHYWQHDFDWQKAEDKINSYKNYKLLLNGIDVHFIHQRSPNPDAIPLIFIHGWPGSFVEAFKIIGLLTNPGTTPGPALWQIKIFISCNEWKSSAALRGSMWEILFVILKSEGLYR